jgi:predicted alpha/beta hydrolase family esterase
MEPSNIFKLIALNLRSDQQNDYFKPDIISYDPYKKDLLDQDELEYFVNHGNNVTIFIHGYNVSYGHFGQPVQTYHHETLKHSIFSRQDIYRDYTKLKDKLPDVAIQNKWLDPAKAVLNNVIPYDAIDNILDMTIAKKHVQDADQLLNGNGAHNWWLHTEWNLNQATAQLDETDFMNYTRLLHISWQGDPILSIDYMAAVPMADQASQKLVPVVEQLLEQGLEINILAHSLGCRIATKLMDILGRNDKYAECLNHVFLWEPAIANNAFTNDFPNVHNAAKKIIVLYSENDNILGPVPSKIYTKFWEKAFDLNSGFALALCAGVVHFSDKKLHTHIQSPYHLANALSYPFTAFLKQNLLRQQFYQDWIQIHDEIEGTTIKPFPKTLAEQMYATKLQYPQSYHFLSRLLYKMPYHYKEALKEASENWFHPTTVAKSVLKQLTNPKNSQASKKKLALKIAYDLLLYPLKALKETKTDVSQQAANELATIIMTVLTSKGPLPAPAMGYSGPDIAHDQIMRDLYENGKLVLVPQHDWLTEHSSMKIPSKVLMNNVYKAKIWCGNPGYHLGGYNHLDVEFGP